jgi:LytS/YehU family sensor histidine kinase
MQVAKAVSKRRRQFLRESKLANAITGVTNTYVIAILQMILVLAWTCIVAVLLDVSPWLCTPYFLENRAIFSLVAFMCILILLPLESIFWDWSIQKGLEVQLI